MPDNRQLTARQIRYRRQQQRRRTQLRFFALSFVAILLLAGVITAIIELPGKIKTAQTQSASQSSTDSASTGENTAQITGAIGPELQAVSAYAAPTAAMLTMPANGRVDMEYFSDALFIGDSLTQGFQMYASGISSAHYAAYVGAGPKQMMEGTVINLNGDTVTAIDEILAAAPKKVYLLLGTNALSSLDDEALLKYYDDFMSYLAPKLPADTVYYVQGIPPVTAEKSEGDTNYANTRIQALDEQLSQLSYKHGWHYLDLYGALADENGNLRAEIVEGSDGVHLNGAGYEMWKEYLVTHTAYSSASPYIEGSPYIL
ncbi:MAG: GDSL-type esterase/lipase family protein [Ruthenibacterium sp.]